MIGKGVGVGCRAFRRMGFCLRFIGSGAALGTRLPRRAVRLNAGRKGQESVVVRGEAHIWRGKHA